MSGALLDSIDFCDDFERDYAQALDLFCNRVVWAVSDRRINPYAYQKRLELQNDLKSAGTFLCLGLSESLGGENHGDGELSENDFRLKYYLSSKANYRHKITLLDDALVNFHNVANRPHPLDTFVPVIREAPDGLPDAAYDKLDWAKMRVQNGLEERGARASILLASQANDLGHDLRDLGWGAHVVGL